MSILFTVLSLAANHTYFTVLNIIHLAAHVASIYLVIRNKEQLNDNMLNIANTVIAVLNVISYLAFFIYWVKIY